MSVFSGKCDFCDHIELYGLDHVKRSKIHIGYTYDEERQELIPGPQLAIESIRDCVPYYPHIITMMAADKDSATIFLTEKSWVDIQEERYGRFAAADYYRKQLQEEIARVVDE